MDEATATTRLKAMTAWDSEPTLTSDQITALVALARRADDTHRWVADDTSWIATTAYTLTTRRAPLTRNGHLYEVTTAGTSGASEPTWPTASGGTVTDGTVHWTEVGGSWDPTYDLNAAAAEGWRWKAAKVAGEFDFGTDQQTFSRSDKHAACLAMADEYRKRVTGSVKVGTGLPIIPPPIVLIPTEEPFLP